MAANYSRSVNMKINKLKEENNPARLATLYFLLSICYSVFIVHAPVFSVLQYFHYGLQGLLKFAVK